MAKMYRGKRVSKAYHRCSDGVYRTHYEIGYRNFECSDSHLSAAAHPHEAEGYVAAARRKAGLRLLDRVSLGHAELAAKANRLYHTTRAYASPEVMADLRDRQQLVKDQQQILILL